MKTIQITETILRDGQQSLMATRMPTKDMLPIIEKMDAVGYRSLEMWGGATFDAALRFLNEDPWDRLKQIKQLALRTPLQMLLRGQTLVGYRHYAHDTVDLFIRKAIENGIDIVRIFDALNDIRNIEAPLKAVKKYGGTAQLALSYTISPVHDLEYYCNLAQSYCQLGADEIAIKDMSGILQPYEGYRLITTLKKIIPGIPIVLHTHDTAGIGGMLYIKAAEAGVDVIDTSLSGLGGGTAQPCTESIVYGLTQSGVKTSLNDGALKEVSEYFKGLRNKYIHEGSLDITALTTEPEILSCQLPGGMLSNLIMQLKIQKAEHRYEEVLKEVPKVRADFGYPPLVTPMSQIVATQAVLNILSGEDYSTFSKEAKDYIQGLYGQSPAPIKAKIKKKFGVLGSFKDYMTNLAIPEISQAKKQYPIAENDEELLSCILLPQAAVPFLRNKKVHKQTIHVEIVS